MNNRRGEKHKTSWTLLSKIKSDWVSDRDGSDRNPFIITHLSWGRGLCNSVSHTMQGHPGPTGHSEVMTKRGPLEEEMVNHSSILSMRTLWTVWKDKKIWHQEMSPPKLEGVQYATGEEQRAITNSSRKNEAAGPKQKGHSAVKCLVVKVKFYFLRTIVHRNLEC